MPTWIQYIPLEPEYAFMVVVLAPILLFMWKLGRRIRAGEDGLKPVFLFWCAVLWLLAAMISVPTLFAIGFPIPHLPAFITGLVALALGPSAVRGWRKEPRAVKRKLPIPDLGLDLQNILMPTPGLPGWESGRRRAAEAPTYRRVRAGRLNTTSVAGIAISVGIAFVWFNLWFTGLMFYGWPAFLPLPACGIAILIFSRRLYRDEYLVEEEDRGDRPSLDLPSGNGETPGLPHLPPPRPQVEQSPPPRAHFGKVKRA